MGKHGHTCHARRCGRQTTRHPARLKCRTAVSLPHTHTHTTRGCLPGTRGIRLDSFPQRTPVFVKGSTGRQAFQWIQERGDQHTAGRAGKREREQTNNSRSLMRQVKIDDLHVPASRTAHTPTYSLLSRCRAGGMTRLLGSE